MIGSLLVGLDGSQLAESVLPYAEKLARPSGAVVILTRAVAIGETLDPLDSPEGADAATTAGVSALRYTVVGLDSAAARSAVAEANEYLTTIAQRLRERGLSVKTVVAVGDPADVLLETARTRHADLILLGTHGRSGFGRWLYGSVAEAVLSKSPIPILLVHSAMSNWTTGGSTPRILIPLDGSNTAETALPAALELAKTRGAEIALVRIVSPTPPALVADPLGYTMAANAYERELEEEEKAANVYLAGVAESIRASGFIVTTMVRIDQASRGILAAADAAAATLIVMATHGRTGFSRALLGSVALDVLRRGTRPVVLLRPSPATRAALLATPGAEKPESA